MPSWILGIFQKSIDGGLDMAQGGLQVQQSRTVIIIVVQYCVCLLRMPLTATYLAPVECCLLLVHAKNN